MLEESIEYAEQDFATRQVIEARNEAESILAATEKGLAGEAGRSLETGERAEIAAALAGLREAIGGEDYLLIRARIDALNHATANLAEAMMNQVLHATVEGKKLSEV